MLTDLLKRASAAVGAPDLINRERLSLPSAAAPLAPEPRQDSLMDEYSRLTKAIGFDNPHIDADLRVERFKAFLRKKDWAVFSLETVTAYMDEKSKAESAARAGWHWRPLREKDNISGASFGRAAFQHNGMSEPHPSSDHYLGPHRARRMGWNRDGRQVVEGVVDVPTSSLPYDKIVPIHALRKVAAIEAEFPEPVAFFVCDYAPAPHIEHPDPFLMAVINNSRLSAGVGRFVIDFWDEPGFGLDKQLA